MKIIPLLVLFAAIAPCFSKTLTVNASLSAASGINYPTLQSAVAALFSGTKLIDPTNTITLLPNTAGTTQTITTSLTSGTGSIAIQFQSPPSIVDSLSACSQLPILSLIGTSFLYSNSLTSLSISGLYIKQKYTSGRSLELNNIPTVTLSNFCLDLTEASIPSTNYWFYISYASQVTITNGYIAYDGTKELWIESSRQINISSLVVNLSSTFRITDRAVIQVYQPSGTYNSNFNISNIQFSCPPNAITLPYGIWSNSITSAVYSNISVNNCDFSAKTSNPLTFLYSAQTISSVMDNITFTNVSIGDVTGQTLIALSGNKNATISNIQVTSLTAVNIDTKSYLISIIMNSPTYYSPGVYLIANNITINNSTVNNNYYFFFVFLGSPNYISGLVVNNFTLDSCDFDEMSYAITVDIGTVITDTTLWTPRTFSFNNLTIINSRFMFDYLIHFNYAASYTPSVEIYHAEFNNVYIANNYINETYLFKIEGFLAQFVNLTAENLTLRGLSTLLEARYYVGTLFVINSTFNNCTLNLSSSLIAYDGWGFLKPYNEYTTTRPFQIEYSYAKNATTMYIETRPFIIYNSVFSNINAFDTSIVVWSTNPQSIFQNNTLKNITLSNSPLLQLGSYTLYISIYSFFRTASFVFVPTVTWFDFFPAAEAAALSGNSLIQALFYSARNQTCSYDSKNCAVFAYVKDNIVDQVNTVDSDYLIGLEKLQVPNSSVVIINNTFSRIQGSSKVDFPIILSDSIRQAFIIGNILKEITILGYIFSLTSKFLDNFFFDSNVLLDNTKIGAYLLVSYECNNITIQNMIAKNLETENNFISMSCTFIGTEIALRNSTFENIVQQNNQGALLATDFIFISTQNNSVTKIGSVQFQDNTFMNITLTRAGGYTTNTKGTSFILLFMTQSYAILQNNTLDQVTLPEGTIMTISVPSLTIASSTFNYLSFGDSKGALNLIVQNFTLFDSAFTKCSSLNYNGTGLVSLTTPDLSVDALSILTNISDCLFTENTAAYGAILYASALKIQFLMQNTSIINNVVSENQGKLIFANISESALTIVNSTFISNQTQQVVSNYLISVATSSKSYLTVSNCSYQVAGNNSGGFLYAHLNPALYTYFEDFTFAAAPNSAPGVPSTGILLADSINAYFANITVRDLTIANKALFIINCDMANSLADNRWNLTIDQSMFDSLSLAFGVVNINSDEYLMNVLNNLTVSIINSTFSNITFAGASSIVTAATSHIGNDNSDNPSVLVRNCSFSRITATEGSAIFSSVESRYRNTLWLDNNTFQSISSSSSLGGGIVNPSTVLLSGKMAAGNDLTLKITNNAFIDINSSKGGLISWRSLYNPIAILIDNNKLESITATQDGGIIYANYPPNVASAITQSAVLNITKNSFKAIIAENGGIIHFEWKLTSLYKINFDSNTCEDITSKQNGGIIHLPKSPYLNYSSLSSIIDSSPQRVLSANNSVGEIVFSNNQINNVSAINGGVIFEFTPNQTLNLSLRDNILDGVRTAQRGGIAYTNQPYLSMQNNIGSGINAGVSGPIVFSMSDQLNLIDSANSFNGVQNTVIPAFSPTNIEISFKRIPDSSVLPREEPQSSSTNPIFSNLTSYSFSFYQISLNLIYIGVFGSQTIADNSGEAMLQLVFNSSNPQYPSQTYLTSDCRNASCLASPSNIILAGNAGDIYVVSATYKSSSFNQFQQFMIRLRECLPGELNQSATGQCIRCARGTYSLFSTDKQCIDCPAGADCREGNDILIQEGYYRSAATSGLYVMPCNDSKRCLGGKENSCSEGYAGPFCLQCNQADGYIPDSGSDCADCNKQGNLVGGVFTIIGGLLYQLLIIFSAYLANKKRFQIKAKLETAPHTGDATSNPNQLIRPGEIMVLFNTFTQICSLIVIVDPGTLTKFLNISIGVGNPSKQVAWSLKCLYYKKEMDPLAAIKLEILFYIFSPLAKILFIAFIELLRMLCKGFTEPKTNIITRLGTVAVFLILLEQPNIIGALTNYLTCSKLDPHLDDQFMKNPTLVQCYTPEYFSFRNRAVFPAIAVWGVAVPLVIFLILFKNRKILQNSESLNVIFGPLYNSYDEKAYYWGLVIMICKMTLFTLNSVLTGLDVIKYVIFIVILQLYYEVLNRRPPYTRKVLLRCETYSILAYKAVLFLLIVKAHVQGTPDYVFDVLILLPVIMAGLYMLVWATKLRIKVLKARVKAVKARIIALKEIIKKRRKSRKPITMNSIQSQSDEIPSSTNRITVGTSRYKRYFV